MRCSAAVAVALAAVVCAAPVENEKRAWYSGLATYYYQNGNPGACGQYHSDSDWVVALQTNIYGGGWACGQSIQVQNPSNGETLTATIADECPTCEPNGIDLSQGLYNALGLGGGNVNYWF